MLIITIVPSIIVHYIRFMLQMFFDEILDDWKDSLVDMINLESCSSSSSSESDDEGTDGHEISISESCFITIIEGLNDVQFKSHMRLKKETIEYIVGKSISIC